MGHTATLLANGRVLIAGGQNPDGNPRAEIYDPKTGRFRKTGSMTCPPLAGSTATLLVDGQVLIAGGNCYSAIFQFASLYSPKTGQFTAIPPMSTPRVGHTATLLKDGRVLIVGGMDNRGENLATAELYTP
jgi:N-acetylneuraminic acid mutarotase